MTALKHRPIFLALASCGLLSALMASKCETTFPPYVQEECGDGQDNDSDGKTDCKDSDCEASCAVEVSIFQPGPAVADSLEISGSSANAASVAILVSPSGDGGQATLQSGGAWTFLVRNIDATGTRHTVKAVATSSQGLTDTASATFERGQ